jgi:drug/metabolite transporter (DMT)-like permease
MIEIKLQPNLPQTGSHHLPNMTRRVLALSAIAMIAFASNSLLCRLALRDTRIDAATFTLVRLLSGAVALWLIVRLRRESLAGAGSWFSALALFVYAAAFSFAYLQLSAGTGALMLFGAVQVTMIFWGFRRGERLDALQLMGLIIALTGLIVLLLPGLTAPPLLGSVLMLSAGVAWGIYSLHGKGVTNPIAATSGNFTRAVPFAFVMILAAIPWLRIDSLGVSYAILSGAVTSGLGYVIWYQALPGLKATSAATVQLSVPVLAAAGGILLLGEAITLRYLLASCAVLGGIALVLIEKQRRV